jgi:hypothetical protein
MDQRTSSSPASISSRSSSTRLPSVYAVEHSPANIPCLELCIVGLEDFYNDGVYDRLSEIEGRGVGFLVGLRMRPL